MKTRVQSAFSLVEVTAVVLVISVLSAMLLSRTNNARNTAQNTVFARLLKDAPAIRQRMIFGEPPNYTPPAGAMSITNYEATSLPTIVVQMVDSTTLQISSLPSWMVAKGVSSFQFDGQKYTINGSQYTDDTAARNAIQW